MVSINTVRNALPPFQDKKIMIMPYQGTKDIVNEIVRTHKEFETDYDCIYNYFDTGEDFTTCSNIWNFLKWNLKYKAEDIENQSVRSPAAILAPGHTVD